MLLLLTNVPALVRLPPALSLILAETTDWPVIILSLIPAVAAKPASGGRARSVSVAAISVVVGATVVNDDDDGDGVVLETFDVALGLCVRVDCVLVWDKCEDVVFTVASVNIIQFKLTTNKIKSITVVTTTIRLVTNLLPSELKIIGKQWGVLTYGRRAWQ